MTSAALLGPPNAGKSVLFTALTGHNSGASPAAYSTDRIYAAPGLRALSSVSIVDLPSLGRNSHRGEWHGIEGLRAARDAAALIMVVRCFQTGSGPLEFPGCVGDPVQDLGIVEREIMIADLLALEERIGAIGGDDPASDGLRAIHDAIAGGQRASDMGLDADEMEALTGVSLLTAKPVIYVLNIDEGTVYDVDRVGVDELLAERLDFRGAPVLPLCAQLHADAALLDGSQGESLLRELGVDIDAAQEVAYALRSALGVDL